MLGGDKEWELDFNQKILEQLSSFLITEAWEVLKYRIIYLYAESMQDRIAHNLRANNEHKALIHQGMIDGSRDVIEITERLSDELKNGLLDADVALNVMENKAREEARSKQNA